MGVFKPERGGILFEAGIKYRYVFVENLHEAE
jgi:hypothetical protein